MRSSREALAVSCVLFALFGCGSSTDPAAVRSVPSGGAAGTGVADAAQPSLAGGGAAGDGAGGSSGGSAAIAGSNVAIAGGGLAAASGAAGAGGAIPAEPRPQVDGAVLWVEAGETTSLTLEGARVAKWQDLTSSHNDAAQANDGMRPTLVQATAAKPAVLHFEAARRTFLGVPDAASLQWGTGDFSVAVVFAFTNQPFAQGAPGVHLGGWAFTVDKITQPSGPRVGWGIMGNWPNGEQAPVRTAVGCETTEAGGVVLTKDNGYNDGVLRLWVMRRDTASGVVELRSNGVVTNNAKGGAYFDSVDTVGTGITIGGARMNPGQNMANFSLEGDVAAIVAIKGAVSDPVLAELEQYLMKKYQVVAK